MTLKVSEREAQAIRESTGAVEKTQEEFDGESQLQRDRDTIEIEELASLYMLLATDSPDPRAKAIFEEAQKAGRIDSDGVWVGDKDSEELEG